MTEIKTYHTYEPQPGLLKSDVDISKAQWADLLHRGCFTKQGLESVLMFLREKDYKATYTQLGKKYNISPNALTGMTNGFSRTAMQEIGGFKVIGIDGKEVLWAIAMEEGRTGGKYFEAKLRLELVHALREYLIDELLAKYKGRVLEGGLDNRHTKELYKWKLLKACEGKDGKELFDAILANEVNILGWRAKDSLKKALAADADAVISSFSLLSETPADFNKSYKKFKAAYESIVSSKPIVADERTAALYLACKYPDKHTIYKSDLYQLLCSYLGHSMKTAGEKYVHYLDLLKPIIAKEKIDTELQDKIHSEVDNYLWSDLLNAQDVLWQMQSIMESSLILGKRFTWIPIYKEIAQKVCNYSSNIPDLLSVIYGMDPAYTRYLHESNDEPLTEICPFTTLGIYNRCGDERRMNILAYLKDQWHLEAELPQDFSGIPTLNAQKSMFFWWERSASDCPNLWDVYTKAIKGDDFKNEFNAALKQLGVRWNITMGLFWAMPDKYLTLDNNTRSYLADKYGIKVPAFDKFNFDVYTDIMDDIRSKMDTGEIQESSFYELSESAWIKSKGPADRNYWLCGYVYDSAGSQLDRFLNEGIWEGYDDKKKSYPFSSIKEGDVIILKTSFTRGPRTASKSCLRIPAIGIVDSGSENLPGNCFRFQVDYLPVNNKEFTEDVGGYRATLHKCKNKAIIEWADRLLNDEESEEMTDNKYSEYVELLKASKNLILTGAPGTGKTYMAKQIAYAMGCKEPEFVQFHPSYDYTDFVEGLRPTPDGKFIRRDGVFKAFCKTAYENLVESQKTVEVLSEQKSISEKLESFLDDAIENGTEYSLKNGNKFRIVEVNDTFVSIVSPDNEKTSEISVRLSEIRDILEKDVALNVVRDIREHFGRAHNTQQDSYTFTICNEVRKIRTEEVALVPKVARKEYVCIIDEINRGELSKIFGELFFSVDPGYRGVNDKVKTQYQNLIDADDIFAKGFFVPDNVYIIGTMNDIDRSVESMDFAIRRRFAWREIKAAKRIDMWDGQIDSWKEEALKRMTALNDAISSDEIGLGDAYHIGPAYFLKLKELNGDFGKLWEYHLRGVLFEYFRGMRRAEDKLTVLSNAYFGTSEAKDEQEGTDTDN